jgi:hypothetical protein
MGIRGELYSTKVVVSNRTYFFNVKENRTGDVFMTIVESKPSEGEGFDRHQIVLFADDMKDFLKAFDDSLRFVEKEQGSRKKAERLAKAKTAESRPAPRKNFDEDDSDEPKRKTRIVKKSGTGGYAGKTGNRKTFSDSKKGTKKPRVKTFKREEK